ncbi:MAG: chemotaxis response regulator protein-glutamate methylesterase [Planctomycetota bacterium]|nr:chemotaxis response regulator protein-glutamate methylesterase [Planctomycetota bacterium]
MPIRVLIVDDSVFMRSMLKSALSSTEGIEVLATAQNAAEGLKKIKNLKPDVVTLYVEMPGMTGLEVLEKVMKDHPIPVVMVSTKTQKGAQTTLKALEMGAVDFVAKPIGEKSASLQSFRQKVVRTIETAFQSNRKYLTSRSKVAVASPEPVRAHSDVVIAIGISAGGSATLHKMVPAIPVEFPPILITQHMPADFTEAFSARLNEIAKGSVRQANQNESLRPGTILIAPGNRHLRVVRRGSKLVAALDDGPKVSGFRPSVDVLFESVASAVGRNAVGVVMTGMGCDGSAGVRLLKQKEAVTIAQDKATSIVYGMPKTAAETGCIDRIAALHDMPNAIADALRSREPTSVG